MIDAVFDANVLVSAYLSKENPGGVSSGLLRFVIANAIILYLSVEIIDEAIDILANSKRLVARYGYKADQIEQYRIYLLTLARIVDDPPPTPGIVPRDPDDDKIIACAVAGDVQYLVSRDHDLLSLKSYAGITIIAPEPFIQLVREKHGRLPE